MNKGLLLNTKVRVLFNCTLQNPRGRKQIVNTICFDNKFQ